MINVYDKLWVMFNNEPKEIEVIKVVRTEMTDGNNGVDIIEQAYAIYSNTLPEPMEVDLHKAYRTKEDLREAIFN